jgi:hypothetical protein
MGRASREKAARAKRPIHPRSPVAASYVLVIEWLPLNDGERRTGTELADLIKNWSRVELRVCWTRDDVIAALLEADHHLKATGEIPVVHFEAHGFNVRDNGTDRAGLCFSQRGGIEQELTWTELAPFLRALNRSARCTLLVVGAACYGLTGLDMWSLKAFAPFSSIVGFSGEVKPTTLADSMRELYRQLFIGQHKSIPIAVQAANRELHHEQAEHLITTSMQAHASEVIRGFIDHELDPATRARENERLVLLHNELHPDSPWGKGSLDDAWRAIAEGHCNAMLNSCFGYSEFPENRHRFQVSVRALFNAATRRIQRAKRVVG